MKNCFILAGELSGEEHAASFLPKLMQENKDYHFWGVGGSDMQKWGVEIVYSVSDFSSMGFTEVIKKFSFYKAARQKILKLVQERKTNVAILIDFQGFNMSLLQSLFDLNVKVLYFVAPQAWAWKSWRTKVLQKYVSALYCILPFEEEWFQARGVTQAQSVAHPSFARIPIANETKRSEKLILWLPGSRKSEILDHWSIFQKVQQKVSSEFPEFQHAIVASPAFRALGYDKLLKGRWQIYDPENLFEVLPKTTIAVAVSGTVTLNCAFMQTPTIVCYKTNLLNAWIFRSFINYKGYVSLANLMLNKPVFPELLQEDCNQEHIFLTLRKWILNPITRQQVAKQLEALVATQIDLKESAFTSMNNYLKNN